MNLKEDMATTVTGINQRGSRWYVTILIPPDLHDSFGKTRVNVALKTSDKREATIRATITRAEWLVAFENKRRELTPEPMAVVSPELAKELALRIHSRVLQMDDSARDNSSPIEPVTDAVSQLRHATLSRLKIGSTDQYLSPNRDLMDGAGLSEADAETLEGLNTLLDAKASSDLARRRRLAVLPLVRQEALSLGIAFDPGAKGAQEALMACLVAYRKARQEITLRDAGEIVETPSLPVRSTSTTKVEDPSHRTLRDVFARWKKSGDKPRTPDSITAYDRALTQFEGQHEKMTLEMITRELGDRYRSWLIENCKTTKTARDRFTQMKSLLKYAAETLQWIPSQPWRSLDIKTTTTQRRRPWTDAELNTFFGAPLHTAYEIPKYMYAGRQAAYWIPLLGLHSGSRLGELCQLRVADIQVVEGIDVIVLTDDGEGQRIKSEAGHRMIPIHSTLIRLGFLSYVKAMKDAGHDTLWPDMTKRQDKASDYFGRWFKDHRNKLGLIEKNPDFHCFRHTVRPLMRRAGVSDGTQDKITGHATKGSIGNKVYDHWTLQELKAAVETIQYPSLKLSVVAPYKA